MKIGIDIDDTIANTFETGMKYAKEFTKIHCNRIYSDIDKRLGNIKSHRHWQEIFEWNTKEEIQFFIKYYEKILREVDLKDDVYDVINKLYNEKNEIIFITARYDINGRKIENITKNWLNENNVPFNGLHLGKSKPEVCAQNNIDVFIDDSYENCKAVQKVNTKVYLIDNVTNRNIEDNTVERGYGWNDLYQKIVKYGEGK